MAGKPRVRTFVRNHPSVTAVMGLALAGLLAFALYWFAPWKLFVDDRINEALPTAAPRQEGMPSPTPSGPPAGATMDPSAVPTTPTTLRVSSHPATRSAEPTILSRDDFRGLEHDATGRAVVLELGDGSRYVRFEDLNVSNGPDLRVYLTDQPVSNDWYVWDDGRFLDLGPLKGNIGDQNYRLSADVDLADWKTVVVWCRRFSVGFAVASIETA